jgi:hypothetical protein
MRVSRKSSARANKDVDKSDFMHSFLLKLLFKNEAYQLSFTFCIFELA